jgi:membrane protease subunit HflK
MERHSLKTGTINWIALLGLAIGLEVVSKIADAATAELGAAFTLVGLVTALVAWFQMRLEASEETERLEMEELARSRSKAALFDTTADEAFPARKARMLFEKWFVPGLTLLLFLMQAGGVVYFYQDLKGTVASASVPSTLGMAMFAGLSLVAFLLGKYACRLAQLEGIRLLRPGGSALMLGSLLAFLATVSEALQWFGFPQYDRQIAWVLTGLLAVVAIETLLALVFEAYRPRVQGKEVRLIYESRLVGLLGQPTGLFATAAQALDYQFGFRVSESWFYRFLEEKFTRFVLIWIGILAASDCVVFIDAGEQGLRERFGRPVGGVLNPGLALKFPRPIDQIHRHPVAQVQGFNVGFVPDEKLEGERTVLWTRAHYKEEFNLLVASREQNVTSNANEGEQIVPVNLLTVSIPVQYLIRDLRAWAYQHGEPRLLLERLANREVVRYMASVDIETIMSDGRQQAARDLRSTIQAAADKAGLGAEIIYVGLQDIHPPIGTKELKVAEAYEKVIGAEQEKEARILEADAYALETVPTAKAAAEKTLNDSRSVSAQKVAEASGRATQFASQLQAFRTAPGVFTARNHLETFARASAGSRKIVILPTNTQDVLLFNLEDKIRQDLLDVTIEPVKKDEPKK